MYLRWLPGVGWNHAVVLEVLDPLSIRFIDFLLDQEEVTLCQLVVDDDVALQVCWSSNLATLVLEEVITAPCKVSHIQNWQLRELDTHETWSVIEHALIDRGVWEAMGRPVDIDSWRGLRCWSWSTSLWERQVRWNILRRRCLSSVLLVLRPAELWLLSLGK